MPRLTHHQLRRCPADKDGLCQACDQFSTLDDFSGCGGRAGRAALKAVRSAMSSRGSARVPSTPRRRPHRLAAHAPTRSFFDPAAVDPATGQATGALVNLPFCDGVCFHHSTAAATPCGACAPTAGCTSCGARAFQRPDCWATYRYRRSLPQASCAAQCAPCDLCAASGACGASGCSRCANDTTDATRVLPRVALAGLTPQAGDIQQCTDQLCYWPDMDTPALPELYRWVGG